MKDDDNPPRFYEPLPGDPYKGMVADRERVDIRIQAYFETLGWTRGASRRRRPSTGSGCPTWIL